MCGRIFTGDIGVYVICWSLLTWLAAGLTWERYVRVQYYQSISITCLNWCMACFFPSERKRKQPTICDRLCGNVNTDVGAFSIARVQVLYPTLYILCDPSWTAQVLLADRFSYCGLPSDPRCHVILVSLSTVRLGSSTWWDPAVYVVKCIDSEFFIINEGKANGPGILAIFVRASMMMSIRDGEARALITLSPSLREKEDTYAVHCDILLLCP